MVKATSRQRCPSTPEIVECERSDDAEFVGAIGFIRFAMDRHRSDNEGSTTLCPGGSLLECYIGSQTYYLYLGLNQASNDDGRFLLAALNGDDLSKGSFTYIGKLRGPRRMQCVMDVIPASSVEFVNRSLDAFPSIPFFQSKSTRSERWNAGIEEQVRIFQLIASLENGAAGQENEFGKVGKDVYAMDYQYPISAFQAFAICLSGFDTIIRGSFYVVKSWFVYLPV
ncbi:hypothetical protein Ddye_016816 [Dipteronia dyeriana]|uniref:Tubby C-terminal domain-containing protein n=1 Tax=Dipteronia dyeriana TaxID=168575 RepID=A0AAD9U7K4_9ROSI|nr:hypothetical protein Ddye_016816 [Dipteronia dyeriana]